MQKESSLARCSFESRAWIFNWIAEISQDHPSFCLSGAIRTASVSKKTFCLRADGHQRIFLFCSGKDSSFLFVIGKGWIVIRHSSLKKERTEIIGKEKRIKYLRHKEKYKKQQKIQPLYFILLIQAVLIKKSRMRLELLIYSVVSSTARKSILNICVCFAPSMYWLVRKEMSKHNIHTHMHDSNVVQKPWRVCCLTKDLANSLWAALFAIGPRRKSLCAHRHENTPSPRSCLYRGAYIVSHHLRSCLLARVYQWG